MPLAGYQNTINAFASTNFIPGLRVLEYHHEPSQVNRTYPPFSIKSTSTNLPSTQINIPSRSSDLPESGMVGDTNAVLAELVVVVRWGKAERSTGGDC